MNTNLYTQPITTHQSELTDTALLALLIIAIILGLILIVVALYGVAAMRRRTVVLKKVDYLVEDITYKSESLNVTVETLNKVSNYALSMDALTKNGLKSSLKLISENRNYIYSILEKMRNDVEIREKAAKDKESKNADSSTKKSTSDSKAKK